jgi:hypothetical protein
MRHTYTAANGISNYVVEEGNLGAQKCMDDFGGPNQWNLLIKTAEGRWEDVQWMNVNKIQQFFKTKLPVYKEYLPKATQKYSLN